MNLLYHIVLEITGEVYQEFDKYWTPVKYSCYGQTGNQPLMFDTEEEANSVKVGYKFLS